MTIADQLTSVNNSKQAIKAALITKGVAASNTLSSYAGNIGNLNVATNNGWVRPSDWIAMPTIASAEEKFAGLFAITSDYTKLTINPATLLSDGITAGTVIINWGDGNSENIAADGMNWISHTYDYTNINLTACTRGYKQALVTIACAEVGSYFYWLSLCSYDYARDAPSGALYYSVPWLDVVMAGTFTRGISIGSNSTSDVSEPDYSALTLLERCRILRGVPISYSSFFKNCLALQEIELASLVDSTSQLAYAFMFQNCKSLRKINMDFTGVPAGYTCVNMFSGCSGLFEATLNLPNVANYNSLFTGCTSLQKANITANIGAASPFFNCYSLNKAPEGISITTNFGSFFSGCTSLKVVPAYNLSSVGAATTPFLNCNSLEQVKCTNINFTVSFTNCSLGTEALNEIFENLSVNGAGKTITISKNPGAASCNKTIATAKGWVVTG